MGLTTSRLIWSNPVRIAAFWVLTIAITLMLHAMMSQLPLSTEAAILAEATTGNIDRLSTREFAFSLAGFIVAVASALAISFFLLHAVMITSAVATIRATVTSVLLSQGGPGFAAMRRELRARIGRHPLLGDAWRTFDNTLVEPEFTDEPLRYTVRAQTILNASVVRDRLTGLKMMPSIPGYFVGIGLLLTFFGLVLALNEAAIGTTSTEVGAMRIATSRLLQVATFKFATSIAGLGASIVLSILFRAYAITIEAAFDRLCRVIESELQFAAAQTLALEMNRSLQAQLSELRSLNGPAFGDRLAIAVSPVLQAAFMGAVQSLTGVLADTVTKLEAQRRRAPEELMQGYLKAPRSSAAQELLERRKSLNSAKFRPEATKISEKVEAPALSIAAAASAPEAIPESVIAGVSLMAEPVPAAALEPPSVSQVEEAVDVLGELAAPEPVASQVHAVLSDVQAALSIDDGSMDHSSPNTDTIHAQETIAIPSYASEPQPGLELETEPEPELIEPPAPAEQIETAMVTVLARLESQIADLHSGFSAHELSAHDEEPGEPLPDVRKRLTTTADLPPVSDDKTDAVGVLENGFSNVIKEINSEVERMVQSMRVAEAALIARAGIIPASIAASTPVGPSEPTLVVPPVPTTVAAVPVDGDTNTSSAAALELVGVASNEISDPAADAAPSRAQIRKSQRAAKRLAEAEAKSAAKAKEVAAVAAIASIVEPPRPALPPLFQLGALPSLSEEPDPVNGPSFGQRKPLRGVKRPGEGQGKSLPRSPEGTAELPFAPLQRAPGMPASPILERIDSPVVPTEWASTSQVPMAEPIAANDQNSQETGRARSGRKTKAIGASSQTVARRSAVIEPDVMPPPASAPDDRDIVANGVDDTTTPFGPDGGDVAHDPRAHETGDDRISLVAPAAE